MSDDDMFEDDPVMNPNPSPSSLFGTPMDYSGVVGGGSGSPAVVQASTSAAGGKQNICPECGNSLKTKSSLTRHIMIHRLNDYTSRKPEEDEIRQELPDMMRSVIEAIKMEPALSHLGSQKIKFCEALNTSCTEFDNFLESLAAPILDVVLIRSRVMPSAQYEQALAGLNALLCDSNFFKGVKQKLVPCLSEDFSDQLLHRMIWRIASKLMEKIQEKFFHVMKLKHLTAHQSFVMSDNDYLAFRDHVGRLLRATFQFGAKSRNAIWKLRCDCLRKRFVIGNEEVRREQFTDSKLWTPDNISLSPSAFSLFIGLEKIIQDLHVTGAATTPENVLIKVASNDNLVLLNDMRCLTTGILPEDAALDFLKDLIKGLTELSGRLESERQQLKAVKKGPVGNVSLRQDLKRNPTKKGEQSSEPLKTPEHEVEAAPQARKSAPESRKPAAEPKTPAKLRKPAKPKEPKQVAKAKEPKQVAKPKEPKQVAKPKQPKQVAKPKQPKQVAKPKEPAPSSTPAARSSSRLRNKQL